MRERRYAARFGYMSATDPPIPDEDVTFPGPLKPECLRWPERTITFPKSICDEIKAARLRTGKGQAHSALLEKHRNLSRIRIASHLAILDGREIGSEEDWRWADVYLETSRGVREWMARHDRRKAAEEEEAKRRNMSGRAIHVKREEEQHEAVLSRAVARATTHPPRAPTAGCAGGIHKRRCITNYGLGGPVRKEMKLADVSNEEVFTRLALSSKVRESDGKYTSAGRQARTAKRT